MQRQFIISTFFGPHLIQSSRILLEISRAHPNFLEAYLVPNPKLSLLPGVLDTYRLGCPGVDGTLFVVLNGSVYDYRELY